MAGADLRVDIWIPVTVRTVLHSVETRGRGSKLKV